MAKDKSDKRRYRVGGERHKRTGRLLSVVQAANWLGLSPWNVRTRIDNGDLPVVVFGNGRKMFIDVNDLEKLIQDNKRTITY